MVQTSGATTKLAQHEVVPAPTDMGALANRINKETRTLHNKIDKMMTLKLALALRDPKIYRQGLQSFYHVFATIERCLKEQINANNEWSDMLNEIWKPEIARTEKCEQDLTFYYDDNREKFEKPMMSEQIEFVNHIVKSAHDKPYLLLAYLHVMYLALFAGGRIMRSSISRATGLFPQKNGLKHEEIDYELLTRSRLTEEQKLEVIEESKYIFEQNGKCVSELERHNLVRLSRKWSYIAATKGYYVLMAFMVLAVLYYVRRLVVHAIF